MNLDQDTILKRILSFSRLRNGLSAKKEIWKNEEKKQQSQYCYPAVSFALH